MPRLKSRTKFPPREFQLLLPEVGMQTALHGSFNEMVDAFSHIVQRNPGFAQKYHWPTDRIGQENFVDERNAIRLLKSGYTDFVDLSGSIPDISPDLKKNWRDVAAAAVVGAKSYLEMVGPTGQFVARELAERRAGICVECPLNDSKGGLARYFVQTTSRGIMAFFGAMKEMDLSTQMDDKLGVCTACLCPMRAKVWFGLDTILRQMPADTFDKLSRFPKCWLLTETNRD